MATQNHGGRVAAAATKARGGGGRAGAGPDYLTKDDALAVAISNGTVNSVEELQTRHYFDKDPGAALLEPDRAETGKVDHEVHFTARGKSSPAWEELGDRKPNKPLGAAIAKSHWYGRGAERLGLAGTINTQDYVKLYNALDTEGNRLIHKLAARADRRHTYELSFAPPKSVSIAALHVGDHRIIEAHNKAVHVALDYIEKHLSFYRKTFKDQTKTLQSDNLVVAVYNHTSSRDNDPQLHSHCAVMNMTHCGEPVWRSLVNDAMYQSQTFLQETYRSEIAKELVKLGYSIQVEDNGLWELRGIPQAALDRFSKRGKAIGGVLHELRKIMPDASKAQLGNAANHLTRAGKDYNMTSEELLSLWEEQFPRLELKQALAQAGPTMVPDLPNPGELLHLVAKHITETQTNFSRELLFGGTLKLAQGQYSLADLLPAFEQLVKDGVILDFSKPGEKPDFKGKYLTTQEMLEKEREVLNRFEAGRGQAEELLPKPDLEDHLAKGKFEHRLNEDQKSAVRLILGSQDRYTLIQGDAGTGKTTAVKAARDILKKEAGWFGSSKANLVGLGFTGRSVSELQKSGGIDAYTIDRFLHMDRKDLPQNPLFLIDESSMVSSGHFFALTERIDELQARAVFVGDGKQLQSIGAGRLFRDLQERSQVQKTEVNQLVRQRTEHLREVVTEIKSFMDGRDQAGIQKALAGLTAQGHLVQIEKLELAERPQNWREARVAENANLYTRVVSDYLASRDAGKSCMVVTPENADRAAINDGIRAALVERGEVKGPGTKLEVCFPTSFTGFKRFDAENYHIGDAVFFRKSAGEHKAGESAYVTGFDLDRREILISKERPEMDPHLDPSARRAGVGVPLSLTHHAGDISLSRSVDKDFAVGDEIVFLKNDKKLGLDNGCVGVIKEVDQVGIKVRTPEGKEIGFQHEQYNYFDHGYAFTAFKSQGATCDQVLYVNTDLKGPSSNSETFYTAVTRARDEAVLYSNSSELVDIAKAFETRQEKTSTFEFEQGAGAKQGGLGLGKETQKDWGLDESKNEGNRRNLDNGRNEGRDQNQDGRRHEGNERNLDRDFDSFRDLDPLNHDRFLDPVREQQRRDQLQHEPLLGPEQDQGMGMDEPGWEHGFDFGPI